MPIMVGMTVDAHTKVRMFRPVIKVDGRSVKLPDDMPQEFNTREECLKLLESLMDSLAETGAANIKGEWTPSGWSGIQKRADGAVWWHAYVAEDN